MGRSAPSQRTAMLPFTEVWRRFASCWSGSCVGSGLGSSGFMSLYATEERQAEVSRRKPPRHLSRRKWPHDSR